MAARRARAAAGDAGCGVPERQVARLRRVPGGGFRQALNEAGFVEGQNLAIEFRWADGRLDRLPLLAADLVGRKVAVVFAGAADAAHDAIRAAAATLPVVFATGSDPVALGLVASLNRPAGNLTGVTVITAALWPKRLELLRELIAPTPIVALLVNPDSLTTEPATRELQAAARRIGQSIIVLTARTERDFDAAFATLVERRAGALVVSDDAVFANRRDILVGLAARHAIPAIYGGREYVAAGGLISYGASTIDQYRQSGIYVGRIQGCQAGRPAVPAADQVRAGDQPRDRQGARPQRSAHAANRRRRGDRVNFPPALRPTLEDEEGR